jgi:hypothetical protein
MASVVTFPSQLDPLAELQKRFCLIDLSGEVRVVDRQQIADAQTADLAASVSFYKRADANLKLRRYSETLQVSSDQKQLVADFWLDPNTHVFDTIAFSPLPTPTTTLNFWSPSPVLPAPGDWSVIYKFLLHRICDGNTALLTYLLRYLAHMLQKPEEKPGVMLILLGGQGTGKGTFFALIRALWPSTTLVVSDVDHVIGGFNASIERAYAVCLDEAIFHGDKKARDRMKSLVTEPRVTIEEKFQPRRTIDSFHRFFAASNHIHFSLVEPDDRRSLFLRVAGSRPDDLAYFSKVHAAIEDTTIIAAMVHTLLALDLTGFNVRQRPKTVEHTRQKTQSLEGFDRYWFEVLQIGCFYTSGADHYQWHDGRFIETTTLRSNCEAFNRSVRQHRPLTEQDISRSVQKWCPSATRCRRKVHGTQQRGYDLPSLSVARQAFEVAIGSVIEWPDDDEKPVRAKQRPS